MEPLKNIYSPQFFDSFADAVEVVLPSFNRSAFKKAIYKVGWEQKELMQRMKHTSAVLHTFFPNDFSKAAELLKKITAVLQQKNIRDNIFGYMFMPDYVQTYGLDDYNSSVKAMELITQFVSCEYAVRPFIVKYPEKMMDQLVEWSRHKHHGVRRLASEGCRPRLPWAMALPLFKKDPSSILPILENLKTDESDFVRRSVANNLNDIAKDNPDVVLRIIRQWKGLGKNTDGIIKHGCRTLLKAGHTEVLKFFSLSASAKLEVIDFNIETKRVRIGGRLNFSFQLANRDRRSHAVRIESAIGYLRQNGQHSKKVFKIKDSETRPGEILRISRSQSFKIITTRKFYKGVQTISILVNGKEKAADTFQLV